MKCDSIKLSTDFPLCSCTAGHAAFRGKMGIVASSACTFGAKYARNFLLCNQLEISISDQKHDLVVWMRACADSSMYTTWQFFVGSAFDLNRDLLLSVYSTLTNMGQLSKCQLRVFLRLNSSNMFFWGPESSKCLLQLLQ
jgi:hypothetical protein